MTALRTSNLSVRLFSSGLTKRLSADSAELSQVILEQNISTTCQQGSCTTSWRVQPKLAARRWQNPLTGWSSTAQPSFLSKDSIAFPTKHSATNYCEYHGLDIVDTGIESLTRRRFGSTIISGALRKELKPKSYGDNFSVHRKGVPIWPPV
jgi:hypothetical protein